MHLTELFKMPNKNVKSAQERTSNSSHPSPRSEPDFCELVWENGQIIIQGQSSKPKKGPLTINHYQPFIHNPQDNREVNDPKLNKFSTMDSVLSEIDLGQDVDMVPWFSYPVEDPLHNDYTCDFLPELSGVTINDISTNNPIAFREKRSDHNSVSLKNADVSKVTSNTKHIRREWSEVTQFLPSSQHNIPKSGVSDITSLRLQKIDAGQPSTSSSFTNFPYFSRPSILSKANHVNVNTSKRIENEQKITINCSFPTDSREDIGILNPFVQAPANEILGLLPMKSTEEMHLTKRTLTEKDGGNDTQHNHGFDATGNIVEAVVVASSVCSGNSVDRTSNELAYDLKRKTRESTESEGPSEEVGDESVGAKNIAHARASSKRSRAAEVHNLSERRRRDRINEKMRALQELIPNCNKVDKASMLDEAIEYLKTLQLQVQMMSMGAGLYMQPMMLPPGMQPIHGAQMPHCAPVGLGMGMGMGFGKNPFQGPHYPAPSAAAPFHGMQAPGLHPFGHPGHGLPMSMQQSPSHSIPDGPLNRTMRTSVASSLVPPSSVKDSGLQVTPTSQATTDQLFWQATKEGIQLSPLADNRRQNVKASESLAGSKTSKEA